MLGWTDLFVCGNQAYIAAHNLVRNVAYRHHCLHKDHGGLGKSVDVGGTGMLAALITLPSEGIKAPRQLHMLTTRSSAALNTVKPGSIILVGTCGGLLPMAP